MREPLRHIKSAIINAPRWAKITVKVLLTPTVIMLIIFVAMSVSAVYDFAAPRPFSGPDIYNPYQNIDTTLGWKRAALHTHSRVDGILNECEPTTAQICDEYAKYGYEIVHFSNHNEITKHPTMGTVPLYEHGYNARNFHVNVYGDNSVTWFDNPFPIFDFQRQFKLDMLAKGADMVQINHPQRVSGLDKESLQRLGGYRIIELSEFVDDEHKEWDWALSAGRYAYGLFTDDLHRINRTQAIAIRSAMLNTPSGSYDDVVGTLQRGAFYSLYTPDYGHGDTTIKRAKNLAIPHISDIGVNGATIYIMFDRCADSIRFTGQNQRLLHTVYRSDSANYTMREGDSYARITAYFADGERIYSNPFARYDAAKMTTPFDAKHHSVNIFLTILYNTLLLAIIIALGVALYKLLRRW